MARVLLLSGTCGSGKSTIASLLGSRSGWTRISEDDLWLSLFGTDRGQFGTEEHRGKRRAVQRRVFEQVQAALQVGQSIALDVTLHESPPEGYEEYRAFFASIHQPWAIRVLHPSLSVAIARDATRGTRPIGPAAIASLRAKFTGRIFEAGWFLDTSAETPADTVARLMESGVA